MENRDKNTQSLRLLHGWLIFAVSALIFAGIFALLIAMARTPFIQELFSGAGYIKVALVGHVNLSFVIWFLAFEGGLWTLAVTSFLSKETFNATASWAGLMLSGAGTILIITASLFNLGKPIFINYVPVLDHPVFYLGLMLLFAGILVTLVTGFLTMWKARKDEEKHMPLFGFGMYVSAVSAFSALLCFALSYYFEASKSNGALIDLETIFWGGGHMLQFANTTAMVSVWLYLSELLFDTASIRVRYGKAVYAIFLIFIVAAPFSYLFYDTGSYDYRRFFTRLMQYGLGPSTGIFAASILAVMSRSQKEGLLPAFKKLPWGKAEFSSLAVSMVLFALGGIISFTISGYNTKVPSHYHGAIGAVTMAFMGMTYHLIGKLGRKIYSNRMARLQPYVYGAGQSLFIFGMFWAGSHGVARKTFGAAQRLDDPVKIISMVIFGLGGLVAIIGGIMFVANAGISLLRRQD